MEALTIQTMVRSARLVPRLDPPQPTAAVMAMNWKESRPGHVRPMKNGQEQHLAAGVSVHTTLFSHKLICVTTVPPNCMSCSC